MIYGNQFRTQQSVTAFVGKTSTSDLVTIVGIAWSGASLIGMTVIRLRSKRNDMARVEKVK